MATTTMLEQIGDKERVNLLARNEYNYTTEYNSTNPNAVSDGDEKGKGQLNENGTVGSLTDINNRNVLMGKNEYNPNSEYNSTSSNAISDGDEKGKGQLGENGPVGSFTDINTRIKSVVINKYSNTKTYPDFTI